MNKYEGHTKGPWSVISYLDEHDRRGRNVLVSDDTPGAKHRIHAPNWCVAYVVPNLADARLIAAAPRLLAERDALVKVLREVQECLSLVLEDIDSESTGWYFRANRASQEGYAALAQLDRED